MAYNKTVWVNDDTEVNAENMNHIEDGVEKAYGQLLLAVDSVAPEECVEGDKYYNTETNKIYTATGTDTWGTTGVDAELGVFYIVLESQNIYTYNGTTLISVGGGAGGGDSTPIGTIQEYAGSTAPDGYLMCDGSAVSRTTYKDLFRVIGTTYGSGDGSTTFNLPNIKSRVVVMLDPNDTDFDTLGETGGSKIHQHLTANGFDDSYFYGYLNDNGGEPIYGSTVVGNVKRSTTNLTLQSNEPVRIAYTDNASSIQPYIVLNKIIKVQKTAGEVLSEQLPVGTEVDFDGTSADIPIGWEQVDSYSTNEVKTGDTWIDGKPIYRRVIQITMTERVKVFNHNIANIRNIIHLYGIMPQADNYQYPMPYISETPGYTIELGANLTEMYVKLGSAINLNYTANIIIEYTKTTD